MLKKNLKKILIVFSAFVLIIGAGAFWAYETQRVGAQTLSTSAPIYCGEKIATTTPNYLNTGMGTTTKTMSVDSFESVTVLLRYFASSTVNGLNIPPIRIQRQASNNLVDWYDYNAEYTLTTFAPNGSSTPYMVASSTPQSSSIYWTPATGGATSTAALDAKILASRYFRLVFSIPTTTPLTIVDGGNIYCEITGKTGL